MAKCTVMLPWDFAAVETIAQVLVTFFLLSCRVPTMIILTREIHSCLSKPVDYLKSWQIKHFLLEVWKTGVWHRDFL